MNRKLTVRKGDSNEVNLNFNTARIELEGESGEKDFRLIVHSSDPANNKKLYFEAAREE